MSARVLRGDVRSCGHRYVVLRTQRGRRGEARTLVVLGQMGEDGIVRAVETRPYATVASWPRVGRGVVSVRDAGGYYYAPRKGAWT